MKELHFLQGLEERYNELVKDENNLYITKDTLKGFLGDKKLWVTDNEFNTVINSINNKLDEISGEVIGTTTIDKLNHISDTKNWIKGAIEYQGQPVPNDMTFRLYHTAIGEIGRKAPVIDFNNVNDIFSNGKVLISSQGSNVDYTTDNWFEPIGTITLEDYGTPASGQQTIIKKLSNAGQIFFNFNGDFDMSGMNNFHITIFTEMPYGFDLSFKTWYNNDHDYYISFPDKLKSKNWNHITIPISDIISNGMNISQLNGIAISGGSTATEATTIYITDMYFK
jgi:hypothetical protein